MPVLKPEDELKKLVRMYDAYWIKCDKISTLLVGEPMMVRGYGEGIVGTFSYIGDIVRTRLSAINPVWVFDDDMEDEETSQYHHFMVIMENENLTPDEKTKMLLEYNGSL